MTSRHHSESLRAVATIAVALLGAAMVDCGDSAVHDGVGGDGSGSLTSSTGGKLNDGGVPSGGGQGGSQSGSGNTGSTGVAGMTGSGTGAAGSGGTTGGGAGATGNEGTAGGSANTTGDGGGVGGGASTIGGGDDAGSNHGSTGNRGSSTGSSDAGTTGTGSEGGTAAMPGWGTPISGGPSGNGVAATVTVQPTTAVGKVGPDFVGFSYEKTQITNASLTSADARLVALYKLLGTPNVRLGANDVDLSMWGGTGPAPSKPSGQPFTHTITTGMVDQLCSFLQATGSRIIYGVNFHSGAVAPSVAEATYVMSKCGGSVYAFEIGNELDKYGTWAAQQQQWESFASAILAIPGTLLVGPASTSGSYQSFTVPFAASAAAKYPDKLVLLTQHYYVAGAGSSGATVAGLQTINPNISTVTSTMNTAAVQNKVRDGYRFGEANSYSGHGLMGVSDALIGGLWAIDLLFQNAIHGSSGVNFHGGETGMDGTKPYYYSPIVMDQGTVTEVQPVYYGMLLFSLAGAGTAVSTTVSTTNPNFTAYAIKTSGFTSVVLVNKNATSGVNATVNMGAPAAAASAIYLQGTPAGSLTAPAANITIAGAAVTAAGIWNPGSPFIQATSGNTVSVFVPAASAALVRVTP